MAKKPLPSAELLRQLLCYEPETGKLFWRERDVSLFVDGKRSSAQIAKMWNSKNSGKEAFTAINKCGYKHGSVNGTLYYAHRLIWKMIYDKEPNDEIDHINLDKADNRLCNLREANHSQNLCNQTIRSDNTTGYQGVGWHKRIGKYHARVGVPGKRITIGYYDTAEDAYSAYCDAIKELHGEFSRSI